MFSNISSYISKIALQKSSEKDKMGEKVKAKRYQFLTRLANETDTEPDR